MPNVKRSTLIILLGIILTAMVPSVIHAGGISVYPLYLFLNAPSRSVTLSITNPMERPQEAWVEFKYGYPVIGDSGKFVLHYVDPPYTGEPSAASWMKAYPQRFVIGPKESQVIRILVAPPVGVTPGEYWARVVISSADQNAARGVIPPGGGVATRLKYISQIDVPMHFRTGKPTVSVAIRKVEATVANGKLNLNVDVTRSGNASFWGRLSVTLRNHNGKILKNDDHPVAIYKDISYPMVVDVSSVPSGTYTMDIVVTNRRPEIQAQLLLKSEPVRYSQELVVP